MPKILLYPVAKRHFLTCIWIASGDPRRPLRAKWIDGDHASLEPPSALFACPLCA